jgi:ubiquitin C-terminal hydrolase
MDKSRGLSGLVNLGNTCFMNSCIQVLNHIHELDTLRFKYSPHHKNIPETQVFLEWLSLRDVMWQKNAIYSPINLLRAIHTNAKIKKRELFTGFAQNDMPEFLLFMIECLHTSICRPVVMRINGNRMTDKDDIAVRCYTMLREIYTKEYSEIMELFYGIYVSEIHSEMSEQNVSVRLSLKPEPFFILDLPLPLSYYSTAGNREVYLEECFDLFTKQEHLQNENAWYNEQTKTYQNAYKRITFWNIPKVLIISLKRFSPDGMRKLNNTVHFPLDHLDLSKYVSGYNEKSYVYELFGVCNHMGNIMGGHYTSFVRTKQNEWFHYNDTSVMPITNMSSNSQTAYCLFYRKKNK